MANDSVCFLEQTDFSLLLARGAAGSSPLRLEALQEVPLADVAALNAAVRAIFSGDSATAVCSLRPKARALHLATADEAKRHPGLGGIRQLSSTLPGLNALTPEWVAAASAANGAVPTSAPWLAALTSSDGHATSTALLDSVAVKASRSISATLNAAGGIATSITAPIWLLEIGELTSHALLISRDGVLAAGPVSLNLDRLAEAVQAELGLKFRGSAIKLFFNPVYDYTEVGPRIAGRLAAAIKSDLAALRGSHSAPIALACIGLPATQQWFSTQLAAALELSAFAPDAKSAGLTFASPELEASVSPAWFGFLQLAATYSPGAPMAWEAEWLKLDTIALPAAPKPAPAPAPAPVLGAPAPTPAPVAAPVAFPTAVVTPPLRPTAAPFPTPSSAAAAAAKPAAPKAAPVVPAPFPTPDAKPAPAPAVPPTPAPSAARPATPAPAAPAAAAARPVAPTPVPAAPAAIPARPAAPTPAAVVPAPAAKPIAPAPAPAPAQKVAAVATPAAPVKAAPATPAPTPTPAPAKAAAPVTPAPAPVAKPVAPAPAPAQKPAPAAAPAQKAAAVTPAPKSSGSSVNYSTKAATNEKAAAPAPAPKKSAPPPVPIPVNTLPMAEVPPARPLFKNPVVLAIIALVIIGVVGYFVYDSQNNTKRQAEETARANQRLEAAIAEGRANKQKAESEAAARKKAELEAAQKIADAEAGRQRAEVEARNSAAARLANARGVLVIATDPVGAMITVGNLAPRPSPATFTDLKIGKYPVSIALSLYDTAQLEFEVKEDATTDAGVVKLNKILGSLELTTEPASISYEVKPANALFVSNDARRTGRTPETLTDLIPGDYTVTFVRDGWAPQVENVTVARDNTAHLKGVFPNGIVKISSKPVGGVVTRDGVRLGVTPLVLNDQFPGDASYVITANGYAAEPVSGRIVGGQVLELNPTLEVYDHISKLSELDQQPKVLSTVQPRIPYEFRLAHKSASVKIELTVTRDGSTRDLVVLPDSDHILANACLEAAAQWKFRPGSIHGRAANVRVIVPFSIEAQE